MGFILEQQIISTSIFNINQDIDICNSQLIKYQQTKTALMQDLLTGKVRVNDLLSSKELN